MKKIIMLFIMFFIIIKSVNWLSLTGSLWRWISEPDIRGRFSKIEVIDWVRAYKDNFTWLYWETNLSNSNMNYESAVNYCESKWDWWRIPSIRELQTIITYKLKNSKGAYSHHLSILPGIYWSNTFYDLNNKNSVFNWYFNDWWINSNPVSNSYNVICVHN